MAEPAPLAALAALREDTTHGAAEIAHEARHQLARLGNETAEAEQRDTETAAREAVLALLDAHPAMAPLVHLADETLHRLDEQGLPALAGLPRSPSLEDQLAEHGAPDIAEADAVLTYSRSGTVLAAVEHALEDTDVRVVVSEARPGEEGLSMARDLGQAGADVVLTYDAALPSLLANVEIVLVGADAITAETFVNKTGTRTLLAEAQRSATPTYVLATSDKLWPAGLPREPCTDVQAAWTPDVPEAVAIRAPLFERVPLELVDHVVTEEGPQDPRELGRSARDLAVHPGIRDAF